MGPESCQRSIWGRRRDISVMGTVAYQVDRVRFLPENPSSIVPITISGVGVGAMAVPCLQREQVMFFVSDSFPFQ